ncbi:MAG: hypothetical protein QOH46_3941, partial [Solirubrobacteraceae bacterium]|nr:hypothetical protein [Solirubrobacteraceae bacterium]
PRRCRRSRLRTDLRCLSGDPCPTSPGSAVPPEQEAAGSNPAGRVSKKPRERGALPFLTEACVVVADLLHDAGHVLGDEQQDRDVGVAQRVRGDAGRRRQPARLASGAGDRRRALDLLQRARGAAPPPARGGPQQVVVAGRWASRRRRSAVQQVLAQHPIAHPEAFDLETYVLHDVPPAVAPAGASQQRPRRTSRSASRAPSGAGPTSPRRCSRAAMTASSRWTSSAGSLAGHGTGHRRGGRATPPSRPSPPRRQTKAPDGPVIGTRAPPLSCPSAVSSPAVARAAHSPARSTCRSAGTSSRAGGAAARRGRSARPRRSGPKCAPTREACGRGDPGSRRSCEVSRSRRSS